MDRGAWGLRFTGSQRVKHGWSDWTHTQRFSHTSLLRYGNDNFMYFHLAAKVTCVYPRKRGNYRNIFTWKYTLAITPKTQNNNSQHFGILCCGVLFLCRLLESPPFHFDTFCCPSNLPTDTIWLLSYKSTETAYPKAANDFLTVEASGQLVLSYLTSLRYLTSLSAFLFWDPLL